MEQSYIITQDVGERLQEFKRLGIEVPKPNDDLTKDVQREIVSILQATLPTSNVIAVDASDMANEILGVANGLDCTKTGAAIVSTSHEIAHPTGGHEIQINRLVDINAQTIGLGPRPGYETVKQQIHRIRHDCPDGVVVVEDGMFSGRTVTHVTKSLEASKVAIKAVVVGINCAKDGTIPEELSGYDVYVTQPYATIVDWVPDHDFLPFIPGSGRTIGVAMGNDAVPYFDHRGATYTIPYLTPFGPMSEWATIPEDKCKVAATKLITLSRNLFSVIESRNAKKGQDITIGSLLPSKIRTSIPTQTGRLAFAPLHYKVSQFLYEVL